MDKNRKQMVERILNLTLEIIYLLTGEDYIVVKKISEEEGEGLSRNQNPIMVSSPHPLIHEKNRYQEILDLTSKMTELLTGEVPIRCQDVTVYLSMEEWEYLEEHKTQYEDIMLENHHIPISKDESKEEEKPERDSSPLYSMVYSEEGQSAPHDHQVIYGSDIKVEDITAYSGVTQLCNGREMTTDLSNDDCTKSIAECHLLFPDYEIKCNITKENIGENVTKLLTTRVPSLFPGRNLSTDPTNPKEPLFDQTQVVRQNTGGTGGMIFPYSECGKHFKNKSIISMHERIHNQEDLFLCPECGKCFCQKSEIKHQKKHRGEKPFPCPECEKGFYHKSHLIVHERTHTGEKPFSCSECGKCFTRKANLVEHQRIHTGEKPYSCTECGKSFIQKSDAVKHQKCHTGEKPFSCQECGKSFSQKSNLVKHLKTHTKEKPFSCSECGKCFTRKSSVTEHLRTHTGEKPYSCTDCGKCFSQKSDLVKHQRSHTGEKPYSCSECGKCFRQKSAVIIHQRIHTGEKPYSCPECGKRFSQKSDAINHQLIHTGEKPFSCSECGKCYNHRSALAQHKRRSHVNVQTADGLPQM